MPKIWRLTYIDYKSGDPQYVIEGKTLNEIEQNTKNFQIKFSSRKLRLMHANCQKLPIFLKLDKFELPEPND